MAFSEFLVAIGEEALWDLVQSGDSKLLTAFGAKTRELLKTYLLVGGMPAAVETYVRTLSLSEVRAVQTDILSDYARDFSKHASKRDVPRIAAIWESLPRQLAKEDKRFVSAKVVVDGAKARARDLHDPFVWLCGIVPIEAKAERNLQAKSLGVYRAKFAPPLAVPAGFCNCLCRIDDFKP